MTTSELDSRNIAISISDDDSSVPRRRSVENLVISSQDAIGQSISQALTFSGVITQHANQVLQEARNVSRSPSPSLRNSDGADNIEIDKGSEMAIHVQGHLGAAGDTISISSGSDITVAAAPKSDNPKVTTPNPSRTSEGRTKKKSWYNSLYPTYKSKSDDFKRLFKDLPDDERLIVDYSCALQKEILAHGRLYASQNYLCFYASIFGWETCVTLRWKDVTAITKEKTALVIPNAILVCTESEKNFLTSFSGRDKAYLMLFRIWQNALMDQPMTSQEIWQWVHSCYGSELGFNSEDEGYERDIPVDLPPAIDTASELELGDSSMEAGGDDTRSVSRGRDNTPPRVTNGTGRVRGGRGGRGGCEEGADTLPTDMSDTSDSDDKHPSPEKCTGTHEGRVLLRQQFPFNIDTMFTMLFTSSRFSLELLAARGARDYVQAPWQTAGGLQCRQVSYVLGLTSGPLGPKEVHVTETQVMNKCCKPGALYSIDAVSENAGIPYADYFTVDVHYCLQRAHEHATEFSVYGRITYKKTVWPMIKAFLEKNAMSGIEEYGRLLDARLTTEVELAAPHPRKARKHRRPIVSSQETTVSTTLGVPVTGPARLGAGAHGGSSWAPRAALLLLLLLNGLLYYRLYHPPHNADPLTSRMESVSAAQMADWSALLEQHTKRQRGELLAWRDALDHTVTHLHQTEKALRKLLETIEPSLAKAQEEGNDPEIQETDARAHSPPEERGEL